MRPTAFLIPNGGPSQSQKSLRKSIGYTYGIHFTQHKPQGWVTLWKNFCSLASKEYRQRHWWVKCFISKFQKIHTSVQEYPILPTVNVALEYRSLTWARIWGHESKCKNSHLRKKAPVLGSYFFLNFYLWSLWTSFSISLEIDIVFRRKAFPALIPGLEKIVYNNSCYTIQDRSHVNQVVSFNFFF